MIGADLAREVSTGQPYTVSPPDGAPVRYRVAAVDLGIKTATPLAMARRGCEVHGAARRQHRGRDPGHAARTGCSSPTAPVTRPRPATRWRRSAACSARGVPVFGICLGSQVLGRALGLGTYKLRFGHRGREPAGQGPGHRAGADHQPQPRVRGGDAGRRGGRHATFGTDFGPARISHVNLNDGVVEGLRLLDAPAFSVQYHPEAAPGPARRGRPVRRVLRPDGGGHAPTPGGAAMPKREDLQVGAGHRVRADRDRAGLRVRLLRHPGLPGAPPGGHPGQPGQLQPGDDHDRPGVRRRHLRRADHPGRAGEGDRQGAPGRGAAHAGRPDRAQRGRRPARGGHPGQVRRRADRRRHRGDQGRRGPQPVQGDRHRARRRGAAQPHLPHHGRVPGGRRRPGLPAGRPALVHPGRLRLRHRPRRGRTCAGSPAPGWTPARSPRCCWRSPSSAGRSSSSS